MEIGHEDDWRGDLLTVFELMEEDRSMYYMANYTDDGEFIIDTDELERLLGVVKTANLDTLRKLLIEFLGEKIERSRK